MHIWINRHWDYITSALLNGKQKAGTIKVFEPYDMSVENGKSDWDLVKPPKIWMANTDHQCMKNHSVDEDTAKEMKDKDAIGRKSVNVAKQEVSQMRAKMVQHEKTNTCAATRQFISSKTMQKCMKRGEVVYLAMVRPTEVRK